MGYSSRGRPHRTLTAAQQRRLLELTDTAADYRDHVLFAFALGTGLRRAELLALELGDVFDGERRALEQFELRVFKRCTDSPAPQDVFPPVELRRKLERFSRWKKRRGQSTAASAPLFMARDGRLSARGVAYVFAKWRAAAGLPPATTFHVLRHTFCQNVYEGSNGDIRLVMRVARHADIATSSIYAQPSAERIAQATRELPC